MRLVWIGGNHPRHLSFGKRLEKEFGLAGAVIQERENLLPIPPTDLNPIDHENFVRHFSNRAKAEAKYFGDGKYPDCPLKLVESDLELSSQKTADFIENCAPDLILLFGPGLIKDPLYSQLPCPTVNLHLGLSPRYRGAATLFWPFYFLEPAYAGSTLHFIIGEVDAGAIVHQSVPKLDPSDQIHDVACKTILASTEDALTVLDIFNQKRAWKTSRQRGTGKNFLDRDFRPEHLRVIYNLFNDDIVKQYLEGNLGQKKPILMKQF